MTAKTAFWRALLKTTPIITPAFRRGFLMVVPFWLPLIPTAIIYVTGAQAAGFSSVEIALMSLFIFSAPAQLAFVQLTDAHAPPVIIFLTIGILALLYILYGWSLTRHISFSSFSRRRSLLAAFLLTDTPYALTIAEGQRGRASFSFLIGAGASMFVAWNGATLLLLTFGQAIPLNRLNIDFNFIVPLSFFIILCYATKTALHLKVALLAVGIALFCHSVGLGSLSVIIAGLLSPSIALFQKGTP